jgi:hypothetical protein
MFDAEGAQDGFVFYQSWRIEDTTGVEGRQMMMETVRTGMSKTRPSPGTGKRAGMMIGLLLLGLAHVGIAGDQPAQQSQTLPRVFQQARLGMTLGELVSLKPNIAVSKRTTLATVTLIATPSDRYIQRVVYRFHEETLYEIEIRYRPERLHQGASGLLARLKELYGPPLVDRKVEVDIDSSDINRRRTVWQDARTKITLLEREYLRDGNHAIEITLTMTDLALQRLRDEAQEKQVHRKMQEVPIPQPEA